MYITLHSKSIFILKSFKIILHSTIQKFSFLVIVNYYLKPDLQNVTFFTPSNLKADKFYPKECLMFGNTKLATKQQSNKIQ